MIATQEEWPKYTMLGDDLHEWITPNDALGWQAGRTEGEWDHFPRNGYMADADRGEVEIPANVAREIIEARTGKPYEPPQREEPTTDELRQEIADTVPAANFRALAERACLLANAYQALYGLWLQIPGKEDVRAFRRWEVLHKQATGKDWREDEEVTA